MEELRSRRELAGFSQIALSRRSGVSRMRVQLAEAGELVLRPEETEILSQVLRDALESRAAVLRDALQNSSTEAN